MNFYKRCICSILDALRNFWTFFPWPPLIQQHKHKTFIPVKVRGFSEIHSPTVFFLPEKLQTRCRKGFTLLEVMMVVAIIGTLAAIAIPNYIGYRQKAHFNNTIQTMRTIERELTNYYLTTGKFPETLNEAGLGHLKDPWGNPFQYLNLQTVKGVGKVRKDHSLHPLNTDYDLYSMGPDGKSVPPLTGKPSWDDIIRANDGAFLGKGSDY